MSENTNTNTNTNSTSTTDATTELAETGTSLEEVGATLDDRLEVFNDRLAELETAVDEDDEDTLEPRTDAEINALIDARLEAYFGSGDGGGTVDGGDALLTALNDHIIGLIEEYGSEGMTEADVVALINEHGAGFPEDRLEAIDQEIANIRDAIGMVRGGVSSTIGPDVPDDGFEHSTPGWGAILTIDEPRQFRDCTVVSNQSGNFIAELWEYTDTGNSGGLIDSTEVGVDGAGEHEVDLELKAPEAGKYLLTRDDERDKSEIALWRTHEDWDGWGDVDQSLTLHHSAHPEFGGEPRYWYYFFSLDVLPYYPDGD